MSIWFLKYFKTLNERHRLNGSFWDEFEIQGCFILEYEFMYESGLITCFIV